MRGLLRIFDSSLSAYFVIVPNVSIVTKEKKKIVPVLEYLTT